MRILYADTDPVCQVNFVNALKANSSWSAKYALSKDAVQKALISESFDLVVVDLNFVDLVLEMTQSDSDIAIIAIGEVEDLSEVEHLFSKGVAQYLKKPFYGNIFQKISKEIENQLVPAVCNDAINPDFGYLERLTKGRVALKIDLMEIYINVVNEELINTAEAIRTKAIKKIGDSAHRMKSNVRMMGLKILMEQLDQIEDLVRAENCDAHFYNLVEETAQLLKLTLDKVQQEVEDTKSVA